MGSIGRVGSVRIPETVGFSKTLMPKMAEMIAVRTTPIGLGEPRNRVETGDRATHFQQLKHISAKELI